MREPNPIGPLTRAAKMLLSRLEAAGVPVQQRQPSNADGEPYVGVWPVSLLPETLPGKGGGGPLRLRVRFLVYAGGGTAAPGLELLDRILIEQPHYLVPAEVSDSLWQAIGARPRPALLFDVPVHAQWPGDPPPRVTTLPQIVSVSLRDLSGVVVAPGGVPLVGMRVAVADGTAATHTDGQGRFTLPGVIAGQPVRLVVTGRGLYLHATVDVPPGSSSGVSSGVSSDTSSGVSSGASSDTSSGASSGASSDTSSGAFSGASSDGSSGGPSSDSELVVITCEI